MLCYMTKGIHVTNHLALKQGECPELSRQIQHNHRAFKSEEVNSNVSKTPLAVAGFEDGKSHNQEMLVASKSWKRQEN